MRKQEGDMIGLEKQVENDLHIDDEHACRDGGGPSYLCDGFTITMWVRFLDKTSTGTLFNYGNPLRSVDPKGFMLETYVLEKEGLTMGGNSETTWGSLSTGTNLFSNSGQECLFL